jgi:hypothetical protein
MKQEVRDRNWIDDEVSPAKLLSVRAEDLLFVREGNLPWPSTRNFVHGAPCWYPWHAGTSTAIGRRIVARVRGPQCAYHGDSPVEPGAIADSDGEVLLR